jgi:ribosomal protein S27AE
MITHSDICPICGKSVLYCDGNRLVCSICRHNEELND